MRVLIEIPHPARVHLFRNVYFSLIEKGHEVLVVYKEKEQTEKLLEIYKIPAKKIGKNRKGFFKKMLEICREFLNLFFIGVKFRPNVFLGGASPVLGLASFLFRAKYISFSDTEHASLTWKLSRPFINLIITPHCFLNDLGKNQVRIQGYKELAYLHPKYFKPDFTILKELGIEENESYSLLRFISWDALHDVGHAGLDFEDKKETVKEILKYGKVFISSEAELPEELKKYQLKTAPEKIHDVLYYAALFFGESGTMATESAILGTPTVRVSTLAKLLGNFKELNEDYDLLYFYENGKEGLKKCIEILDDKDSKEKWKQKANKLMNDKIDVTDYLIQSIEKYNTHG